MYDGRNLNASKTLNSINISHYTTWFNIDNKALAQQGLLQLKHYKTILEEMLSMIL